MKILLLQARAAGDPVKEEERASFAARAGLPLETFVSHDLLQGPPSLAAIRSHEALMIGGSGDYDVSKGNLPFHHETLQCLLEVVALGHPTFASCFGFHMLAEALGGSVRNDPATMEVGTYEITLTAEARQDELFSVLPIRFPAQLGHKERVMTLPGGVTNLARSALCPYQALRIPGKPIWASQFHPELSGEDNRLRYTRYMRVYAGVLDPVKLEETLQRFGPSPEAERLIPRFLELL